LTISQSNWLAMKGAKVMGRFYPEYHPGWEHFLFRGMFSLIFMGLLVAAIVALIIAIRRGSVQLPGRYQGPPEQRPAAAAQRDPALEEVRMRYARGEITREEFTSISQDLKPGAGSSETG
jgi:uncharacterized membrane protein